MSSFIRLLKTPVRLARDHYLSTEEPEVYVARFNKMNSLQKKFPVSLDYDPETKLYIVREPASELRVARKSRLPLQLQGLQKRQQVLYREYTGDRVSLNRGDYVLDCGANIGEFSLHCSGQGARVISFEPDPTEFNALRANATENMSIKNFALWNANATLTFFDKNETGDSSLIDPGNAKELKRVTACQLDSLDDVSEVERIRLFKLEAEGAEPEILEGAEKTLKRVEFVAADLGPERGVSAENTVPAVANWLIARGFEIEFFFPPRCTALFRNRALV